MSKVSRGKLAVLLAERFAKTTDPKQLEREVAAYLLSEKRVGELDSLLRDISQYRADHGRVEAEAVSARPLSALVQDDLKAALRTVYPAADKITINERIDKTVVGGVRLQLANQQLDASIRAKLNKFKQLVNSGKD